MVKLPEWTNGPKRRYILSDEDVPTLEREAGVHEFVNRRPRGEAEDAAYNDYKRKHHVQGAAYHLGMMRAAAASGSGEAAKKHKLVYDLHRQSLGFGANDHQIPDEVQQAMQDPSRLPAPKFQAHKADAFLLGKSEPLPPPENKWAEWEKNAPDYNIFGSKLGKSEAPVFQLVKASDHPLAVNFLTNKLRGIRDWFDQEGIKSVNEKDLPIEVRQQLMRVGRDYGGNFTRERLQQFIESQPAQEYNWSTGKFDRAMGATQRHSSELSNVLRLEATPQHKKQLEQAGVMDVFHRMNEGMSAASGHPVGPDTVGWVRHTGDKSGVMVDEVQTDFGRPWPAMLSEAVDKAIGRGEGRPEDRQRHIDHFMQQFPEEQRKAIAKILFGNKHPAEVLQEGFDSWARGPGELAGAPVHIWTPEAKGYQTIADPDPRGRMSTKRGLPRHFHETYRTVPVKRGYEPGQYGEIPTQSNPKFKKPPRMTGGKDAEWRPSTETYKGTIRKGEADMSKSSLSEIRARAAKKKFETWLGPETPADAPNAPLRAPAAMPPGVEAAATTGQVAPNASLVERVAAARPESVGRVQIPGKPVVPTASGQAPAVHLGGRTRPAPTDDHEKSEEILTNLKKSLAKVLKDKIAELEKANPGAPTPGMSGGAPAPAGKIAAPTAPSTAGVKPMAPGALDSIKAANAAQAPKLATTNTSGMPKPAKLDIKMAEKQPGDPEAAPAPDELEAQRRRIVEHPQYAKLKALLSEHQSKSRIPGKKS